MADINVTSDFIKLLKDREEEKSEYVDFSVNSFTSIVDALTSYIKAFYPLDYNNFTESDLGVVLIELVAYMGTVLSLKADMLAHENFISLAKNRDSVRKLLELIGVSMKGPISSVANANLEFTDPTTEDITIPGGNRVVTIVSPEDGAPLNFTLYKTVNGEIDVANAEGEITLTVAESGGGATRSWNNLALIEGALVHQEGTFSAPNNIQTIELTESPVAEKSVQVYITHPSDASGYWAQEDNLYFASGNTDKIFQVSYNDNFTATVTFGDGNSGKAVPAGATYDIYYRAGGGSRGKISNSVINSSLTCNGVATEYSGTLSNTSVATGGADAESVESAKKYAPLVFKTQNRLVTLEDYNTFCNTFISSTGSTAKAAVATRKAFGSANIIDVYLLEKASDVQLQKASISFKTALLDAMDTKKMITDEIVIVDGLVRTVDLAVTIIIDKELLQKEESIKANVAQALQKFFSPVNREFGQSLSIANVNKTMFNVNDVRFANVDNFGSDVSVEFNEIIQLNNLVITVVKI
jgi:hypothetical protein